MVKKQIRNNTVSCLLTDCDINGFPPLLMNGKSIREHTICEVMDHATLIVKAIYKLHEGVWYRYDLVTQSSPLPPPPPPPPSTAVYIDLTSIAILIPLISETAMDELFSAIEEITLIDKTAISIPTVDMTAV